MQVADNGQLGWGEPWPAPAKINLMLRIVGRREDGYHLLQTVFQMTDLCDYLTFYALNEDQVKLNNTLPGVVEQDDLIVKAANLLKQHSGCKLGVKIAVEKNLPMGGGLGGGSSDAATTLVVLNHLWGLGFSVEELMVLGLQLGADVPVFIYGVSAWAEGVGEKLQSLILDEPWIVIIKPDCHVNTKQIFLHESLTRNSKSIKMVDFLGGDSRNDCTEVVCKLYPEVEAAMRDLAIYSDAKLTGTGACVFGLFGNREVAEAAFEQLKTRWQVFVARGLNRSPLYVKLEQKKYPV